MKLIIQIPCYNEEETLPQTIQDLPKEIPGISKIETLIVDDGSSDKTIEVAESLGVDHIVRHLDNRGLARSFRSGIDQCLRLGADIIVNTDGDNQYCGQDIPKLVEPIVNGEASIVIGDRQTQDVAHFSTGKKLLQKLGSFVVRKLSDTKIPDAVSGFRAFSRPAAMDLNIVSTFSYTIETIIQAGNKKMTITSVPIRTNPKTRESRLFKSIPQFLQRSVGTMVRMYAMYQPLKVFLTISMVLTVIGIIPIVRFIIFYQMGEGQGHVQSLVLGGVLFIVGFVTFLIGIVADLISFNRQLTEMTLERVRILEEKLSK